MLPFLKHKPVGGLIVQTRMSDGNQKSEPEGDHAMEAAAEDILRALSSKDAKHLALALRSAFQILESEPSEESSESEGSSKHDYDSQNIKAAKMSKE